MSAHSHKYLDFIDGVRAIAVLGVVLYHFGATWLPGGFVGVDVFFVISGFLISRSIYEAQSEGRLSIADFYDRRARRILPAFFVVTVGTSVAAWLILFPTQLVDYAKTILAAATFTSNIYFYATTNYFGPTSDQIPLLHYWSLGVEEQFYIVFPILTYLIYRFNKEFLPTFVLLSAAASFAACYFLVQRNPSAAFYLLPFRAFELLIGCAIALASFPRCTTAAGSASAQGAGLALILASMIMIDKTVVFPGLAALAPAFGTAFVIWGGTTRSDNFCSRALTTPPFVFVGRVSYSLYLVHWPIVVFLGILYPGFGGLPLLLSGSAASIALAWLLYRTVEQPVRINRHRLGITAALSAAAGSSLVLAIAAGAVIAVDGAPGRIKLDASRFLAFQKYDYSDMFREGTCFLRPEQSWSDVDLSACFPQGTETVILGSSYLAQFAWGLDTLMKDRGQKLGMLTSSGCTTLLGVDFPDRPNCRSFNDNALGLILERRPKNVIMGGAYMLNDAETPHFYSAVKKIADAGIKVFVFGTVPHFSKSVPIILAERISAGNMNELSGTELLPAVRISDDAMQKLFGNEPNVSFISVLGHVCPNDQCILRQDKTPFHFDTTHLTREGSNHYAQALYDAIFTSKSTQLN